MNEQTRAFMEKAMALEVEETMYRHFRSDLPTVEEMRELLAETDKVFEVHETVNGYTVTRKADSQV